jgi:hypothetical protein
MIKKYLFSINVLCLIILLPLLTGCGQKYEFKEAKRLEKRGYYVEAGLKYERISDKFRTSPLAPEALYNAGCIYQKKLKLYSKARMFFTRIMDDYPKSEPWAGLAANALFDCPDYFPLVEGSFWMEGDSKSSGKNMRTEWVARHISGDVYNINRQIFAGSQLVVKIERYFKKENNGLLEFKSLKEQKYTKILSFPFIQGNKWESIRDGVRVRYEIVSAYMPIQVVAGKFDNCLKVSERSDSFPNSIKYNYYAPEVGWVLTTASLVGGQEFRNSELISYKIARKKEGL